MNPRNHVTHGDTDWKRAHVCGNKTEMSESDAWRAAKRFRSKGDDDAHAYRCTYCGKWHVGFQSIGKTRRAERRDNSDHGKRRQIMREDQHFDVQAEEETEMLTDPEYLLWIATEEGETDHDLGVSLVDGCAKLRARGADEAEVGAYKIGWSRGALFNVARDAGIPVPAIRQAVN